MITTERLELVPPTLDTLRAAIESPAALAEALDAAVPATWPPEFLDRPALEFTLARFFAHPDESDWWMFFVLLRAREGGRRTLIGSGGYKGPPGKDGAVEIGYGIVADRRRQGYASEAALGLVGRAFADPRVTHVLAHTLPDLVGSIGVLRRCGFRPDGDGEEPGTIRFRLDRERRP
jgi:ribosomal-protein-alanine N-acetyltransferase